MSLLGTEASFYHHRDKGVDWVFVEHPSYHRAGGLYGDSYGVYGDNQVCYCEGSMSQLAPAAQVVCILLSHYACARLLQPLCRLMLKAQKT